MKCVGVIILILHCATVTQSEKFEVVGPADPPVAPAGEDVVLPCYLKPSISAEALTVEWTVGQDLKVHLYQDHKDRNDQQSLSYRGRTTLFKEELQKGNASLKLSNVRLSDEGNYKCLIYSDSWFDEHTFQIKVEAVGTDPVIKQEDHSRDGRLSLVCESRGWYPEPEVLWLNKDDGKLLPAEDTEAIRETEGFYVKRCFTVPDSDTNGFICRVRLRDHVKQADIIIVVKTARVRWALTVGIIVFVIGLIVMMWYHCKEKESQWKTMEEEFETRREYAVDVTLDPDTAHHDLILSDDGKVVRIEDNHSNVDPKRFDKFNCVLGREGFQSGKFYYEVQVGDKPYWLLGVSRESAERNGHFKENPTNGYWTIMLSSGTQYFALESVWVRLPLSQKPKKIGIFVDYEKGKVTFYDVGAKSIIYSFTDTSFGEEKIYPFFCTCDFKIRKYDNSAPLVIIPVEKI